MSTIFIRERRQAIPGEKKPRFRVVAVAGTDLKFKAKRVRRAEVDAIAEAIGAKVIYLPREGGAKFGEKPK